MFKQRNWYVLTVILLITSLVLVWDDPCPKLSETDARKHEIQILKKAFALQVPFVANEGQMHKDVRFYAPTFGGTLYVSQKGEMIYSIPLIEGSQENSNRKEVLKRQKRKRCVLKESLIGSLALDPIGVNRSETKLNYFKGTKNIGWKRYIPSYNEVDFGEVYRGISLHLRAYGNNVEKVFIIKSESNPETIKIGVEGAQHLGISKKGELEVLTGLGKLSFTKPVAYQERNGKKEYVEVAYRINLGGYGFRVGKYDRKRPLIIDPILASTYLGGSGDDRLARINRDSLGNLYAVGYTNSPNFPSNGYETSGYDPSYDSGYDVFISKFSPNLSKLLTFTFIGGNDNDYANSAVMDSSGNIYVTGWTYSNDFPTQGFFGTPAYDTQYDAFSDVFISMFDSTLQLLASTFIGGSSFDEGRAISLISPDGSNTYVYVAGNTSSNNFPSKGYDSSGFDTIYDLGFDTDVYVLMLDSVLSKVKAFTLIDGNGEDTTLCKRLITDSSNNIYIIGYTNSDDFETKGYKTMSPYDATHDTGYDVFVSYINAYLTEHRASTIIGGSGNDRGQRATRDNSSGNIYITGWTDSGNFPSNGYGTAGYDTTHNGNDDVFVAMLDSVLSQIVDFTFIGGSNDDRGLSPSVDGYGNIWVVGYTFSSDYPITSGTYNTGPDLFFSRFSAGLGTLLFSSLLGGDNNDIGSGGFAPGYLLSGGITMSTDFPTTTGAYDTSYDTNYDVFISLQYGDCNAKHFYFGQSHNLED